MLYKIVTLLILALTTAQEEKPVDCGEEFRICETCKRTKVVDRFNEGPWSKINITGIHESIKACFENEEFGCTDMLPILDDMNKMEDDKLDRYIEKRKDELSTKVGPLIHAMGKSDEQIRQIVRVGIKCGAEMLPTLNKGISTCVSQLRPELSTYTLPPLPTPIITLNNESDSSDDETMSIRNLVKSLLLMKVAKGDPIRQFMFESIVFEKMGKKVKAMLAKKVFSRDTCRKDFDGAQKLGHCLQDAVENNVPDELKCSNSMKDKLRFYRVIRQMCDDKDACTSGKTEVCTQLYAHLPSLVCSCGQSYIEAEFETIAQNTLDCMNNKLPEDNKLDLPPVILRGSFKEEAIEMLNLKCKEMKDERDQSLDESVCSDNFKIETMFKHIKDEDGMTGNTHLHRHFNGQPLINPSVVSDTKTDEKEIINVIRSANDTVIENDEDSRNGTIANVEDMANSLNETVIEGEPSSNDTVIDDGSAGNDTAIDENSIGNETLLDGEESLGNDTTIIDGATSGNDTVEDGVSTGNDTTLDDGTSISNDTTVELGQLDGIETQGNNTFIATLLEGANGTLIEGESSSSNNATSIGEIVEETTEESTTEEATAE